MSIVKHISDRLFVMYLGSLVEVSPKQSIYNNPVHLYTKVLLNVIPIADPQLARQRTIEIEKSELPSPINPSKGCAFHTRCKIATDICKKEHPSLISIKDDVYVACHNI
ncbi:oligopeptide/dipeptide ABC transporter ATP-binding protein [Francisella orientalis]|uniref:oligopeptide/dipeptide ABC transporter ATP-binding protein n=1 Tax=Francisella orientalis TaxID=299583 RepID=UPI000422BC41